MPRDTKCVVWKYTLFSASWSIVFSRSFVALNYTVKGFSALKALSPSGHYMYRTVVTICTAQWSLYVPHSGHYMYRQFNIQQFHVLPTQCIYVFCVDLRTNSDYFPIQH